MMRSKRGAVFVALGAVVSVAAAACSSGSGSGSSSNGAGATTAAAKGGTLTVLTPRPARVLGPPAGLRRRGHRVPRAHGDPLDGHLQHGGQAGAGAGPRDGHRQGE